MIDPGVLKYELLKFLVFKEEQPTIDNFAIYLATKYRFRIFETYQSIKVAYENESFCCDSSGELYHKDFIWTEDIKEIVKLVKKKNPLCLNKKYKKLLKQLSHVLKSRELKNIP